MACSITKWRPPAANVTRRTTLRASAVLVTVALVAACDPGTTSTPTSPPRGGDGGATQPTTVAPTCPAGRASPLLLQAEVVHVSSLEAAMAKGVAVVAFDCTEVEPLPSCWIDGQYQFVERPRIDVDRRFASREEVDKATSLLGRPSPPLAIEAGEVLELQVATLGFDRASVERAARRDLQGECAGATHFVRAARVGAYGIKSTLGTTVGEKKGGRLDACAALDPKTRRPQSACRAPLQLELVPIAP